MLGRCLELLVRNWRPAHVLRQRLHGLAELRVLLHGRLLLLLLREVAVHGLLLHLLRLLILDVLTKRVHASLWSLLPESRLLKLLGFEGWLSLLGQAWLTRFAEEVVLQWGGLLCLSRL